MDSVSTDEIGDFADFLHWLSKKGPVTVWRPGEKVEDPVWGTYDAVDDRYTVHLHDEYD